VNGDSNRPENYDVLLTALINLGKLLKTVLKMAAQEALLHFSPLLQNGNLTLIVRKDGFFIDQEPIGKDLPVLKNLAFSFFARLVHRILFLPELTARDLSAFARSVILSPEEIQKAGGLQELLLKSHVTGIWINEVDLAKIQAAREQMAAHGLGEDGIEEEQEGNPDAYGPADDPDEYQEFVAEGAGSAPKNMLEEILAGTLDLAQLLDQMSREISDQRFSLLAAKLPPKVREQLHAEGMPGVLKAVSLLKRLAADHSLSIERRRDALNTLQKLASEDVLEFLVNHLCMREMPQNLRNSIAEALTAFKERAILFQIKKLADEENAQARRHLSESLIRQGPDALPALVEALADNRWYVTRNIIVILGKIREAKVAAHLRPYLQHKEPRVARETVRTLARIGGAMAVKSLLQAVETADQEIRIQAFLALGVMKDTSAVSPLIQFVKSSDPLMKRVDLKKAAIKALGAIGSTEAEPCLQQLLRQKRVWRKSRFDALRCCAAQALGQIGGEDSMPFLETATADRSKQVARAATQALSRIQQLQDAKRTPQ
jgi:HEAT repeat protein